MEPNKFEECACERCVYNREVQLHLAMLPAETHSFFKDMYERLSYTENELDHANVILDGSWPTAVPQLQASLDKAWEIAREEGYDRDWPAETSPMIKTVEIPEGVDPRQAFIAVSKLSIRWAGARISWPYQYSSINSIIGMPSSHIVAWFNKAYISNGGAPAMPDNCTFSVELFEEDELLEETLVRMVVTGNGNVGS